MNKKKLKINRNQVDKIDNQIFELIKKITKVVNQMLKLKQFKNQIIDHKRISDILAKIKKKSIKNKIDPKITYRIWKAMIWSYVQYQRKKFDKK